jgi:hypothetical protein
MKTFFINKLIKEKTFHNFYANSVAKPFFLIN